MAVASERDSRRNRYDSGFEDEMNDNEGNNSGVAGRRFRADTVSDWSFKTHSIIAQEVVRMRAMTKAVHKRMDSARSKAERDVIANRWGDEMRDMMEITVDLIQCVSNDIVESHSGESSVSSESMTSQDLGKIIEDELGERKADAEKRVLIVRTKKTKRKRRRKSGKWESKNTFTIRVDELQKKDRKDVWQWKKDSSSPVVWKEGAVDGNELEPEDIYRDWVRMMRRTSAIDDDDNDINDVFWSISFGGGRTRRERRISEVLENLPFQDQPDIFEDRCDLLDAVSATEKRSNSKHVKPKRGRNIVNGRKRQPKSYWNIFDEWKKIFREPRSGKRQRKRPLKRRRRPNRRNKKQEEEKTTPESEDFFADFASNFKDGAEEDLTSLCDRGRRRSRELVEDDRGEVNFGNVAKRQRTLGLECRKNWEVIRMESSKTFDLITMNIEQKIREAFQEVKKEEIRQQSKETPPLSPSKKMLDDSRREFIRLREQVRQVRQERSRKRPDQADLFEEWKWNLHFQDSEPENKEKRIELRKQSSVKSYPKLQIESWTQKLTLQIPKMSKTSASPMLGAKMRQRKIAVKSYATQPRRRGGVRA